MFRVLTRGLVAAKHFDFLNNNLFIKGRSIGVFCKFIQAPKLTYLELARGLNVPIAGSTPFTSNLNFLKPLEQVSISQSRSVTKFSLNKGKRKSVKAVIKRFKRLHWGAWIRTYSGRHKKLSRKSAARKRRLRQHVFVNATQSWLLDKMVTSFWRRPKYYVDDPYEPYHTREEYFATKSKPKV